METESNDTLQMTVKMVAEYNKMDVQLPMIFSSFFLSNIREIVWWKTGETSKSFTCVSQPKEEEEYGLVKIISCSLWEIVSLFTEIMNFPGIIIKRLSNIYFNIKLEK